MPATIAAPKLKIESVFALGMIDRPTRSSVELGSRPPRIFLSYRREDAAPYAGRLYDALAERFGEANVFMDVDTISLGTDYAVAIDRALASCDAVVTLIGRNWLDARDAKGRRRLEDPDDVLRLELERALSGPLLVVPTCVQQAPLPKEEELPPTLAPLARRQGIELRDEAWRDDVVRLVRRLEQAVSPSEQLQPAERVLTAPWRRRPAVVAAGAIMIAAALAGILMLKAGRDGGRDPDAADPPLLRAIPAIVRSSCSSIDWGPPYAMASVSCQAADVVSANYHLFESSDVLHGWYVVARENAKVGTDSGMCTPDDFSGEGAYQVDGADAGRRFCYFNNGEATMVWTDDDDRVGGAANVWSGTGAAAAQTLLAQWDCCLRPHR